MEQRSRNGFTLIELAIVLVIIGLLIGGTVVGRIMIETAQLQAQITQIEKYTQAVQAFRLKYDCLPGDCAKAAAFGFHARGTYPGQGDGNKVIEGTQCLGAYANSGVMQATGEAPMLWVDLSQAGLINRQFTTARANANLGSNLTGTSVGQYFPQAALKGGNYIYAWSGGATSQNGSGTAGNGNNYWGISLVSTLRSCSNGGYIDWNGVANTNEGLTVIQAASMDKKVDDGMPLTGKIHAMGLLYGNNAGYASIGHGPGGVSGATRAVSATTCFDNNNVSGEPFRYSTSYNSGAGRNCALSFQF